MVRGGRVKFVALNYDIVTDPYEVIASTLERPLTMPMYEQSKAKLKVVYDSLDQLGPFPVHDWYNGSLRKWLKKFGKFRYGYAGLCSEGQAWTNCIRFC